jgi:RNA polymerase sigma-70 factor (ECF subfamily)
MMVAMQRDLVLRARSGDHEAFTDLAALAIPRMHRTARLILRDDDRASDAVQDALVTAWLDIRALRDPDRFDAWLHRLLVRACYRAAGAQRRQAVVRIDVIDLEGIVPTDPLADLTARDQIDRAFRRITPQERAVLVVHFYLELRDAEAADVLGIAAGTFKSRLHRAKASLRAAIDADDRAARRTQETMA